MASGDLRIGIVGAGKIARERHLPAKRNAELTIDERPPEQRFGRRWRITHGGRMRLKKSEAAMRDGTIAQRSLLSPPKRPGPSPSRAGSVTGPRRYLGACE